MSNPSFVRTLYRFQQRIGMTAPEFRAVSPFAVLLLAGSTIEHLRHRVAPIDPAVYAETDAYFERRARESGLRPAAIAATDPAADQLLVPLADSAARAAPDSDLGPAVEPGPPPTGTERIDINLAGSDDLERLPGIGPALAARILDFRRRNGPFRYAEDLLMVRGIGGRTMERLAPLITVDGTPPPSTRIGG